MISSTIVLKPFEEYVVGNTTDGRLVQIFEFDSFRTNETQYELTYNVSSSMEELIPVDFASNPVWDSVLGKWTIEISTNYTYSGSFYIFAALNVNVTQDTDDTEEVEEIFASKVYHLFQEINVKTVC